jgi:hypothetical protein
LSRIALMASSPQCLPRRAAALLRPSAALDR